MKLKSKAPDEDVARWTEAPWTEETSSRPEQRVARLMRRAAPATLSEGARARIRRNIARRLTAAPAGHRSSWHVGVVRWAVIALVFLAGGVVVAAAGIKRTWRVWEVMTPSTAPPHAVASARSARWAEPVAPRAQVAPAVDDVAPPAPVAPPATVSHERTPLASRRVALEAQPPPEVVQPRPAVAVDALPPSPLSAEAELLKRVLMRLRRARDGQGALADLDAYFARFPNGLLRPEADAARAECLLSLGRDQEALRVLDGLSLPPRGRAAELRVIRGELRASSDCAGAIVDFDATLDAAIPQGLAERALYGRASCRARTGDRVGARRDLDEYARRFPSGRFAPAVRRARGL